MLTSPSSPGSLSYEVHVWVGDEATEDEYAAAVYKMVELDRVLSFAGSSGADAAGSGAVKNGGGGVRVLLHRQGMGQETAQFLDYFGGAVQYLAGEQ